MLEVKSVSKKFGSKIALEAVSLKLEPGEAVVLRGPSGCGKTTLLHLIAGLITPDIGEIWLRGEPVSKPDSMAPPYRRRLAMVFQEPRLWPHMTIEENMKFALSPLPRDEKQRRLEHVAHQMQIGEILNRYPGEISVGQARRAALARALSPRRSLILMDEPLTNLDDAGRHDMIEVIHRFWLAERFALLYVTHGDSAEASFAKRVICMDNSGKISAKRQ